MILNLALLGAIGALLIPLYQAIKAEDIWQTMLAFSSVSTKAAAIALLISVVRDDWMVGMVGAIVMTVGNAGFMLLAHILKRLEDS